MDSNKERKPFYYQIKNPEIGSSYDPLKKENDFLTPEEKAISEDLKMEYNKALNNFQTFLEVEFMRFEYKMNYCMLKRCYNSIFETREKIRECNHKCQEGLNSINTFVSNTIDQFNENLNNCLQSAQRSEAEVMNHSFNCYRNTIEGVPTLKETLREEFSYYKA